MAASVEEYRAIVARAYEGRLKLPAFQREWKWKTGQVILLFDSLRQGFPIGGFLFIKESPSINLAPRELRGASKDAHRQKPEQLVLDGQLVVSLLFPQQVNLAEDVDIARSAYPYYAKVDETGDILLQTIALFAGKDTKKASL